MQRGGSLLILTQAVDTKDPVLGFFHAWIHELAARHESVSVVCLKEGAHTLPENVRVYSLGKESGSSRGKYLVRLCKYVWALRDHKRVFVHMNEEYVLLAGWFWIISGARIVLWRNHKMGSWRTRIAVLLSDRVCHTSTDAYVAYSKKALRMPIGIDTKLFIPPQTQTEPKSVLFFGRLDRVKRPELFVEAVRDLVKRNVAVQALICGSPTYRNDPFAHALRSNAPKEIVFRESVEHREAPKLFALHSIYVNLTPSGSFDKTIGEALASGCVLVAANENVRDVIHPDLFVDPLDQAHATGALERALALTAEERRRLSENGRAYVEERHSLRLLADTLCRTLATL